MMAVETLHGIARTLWLAPYISDFSARQVTFFTGSLLILTIATLFARWLRASRAQLLGLGVLWATLTLLFELGLGRLVLHYSWERVLSDYNLLQGGFMALGLVILVWAPFFAVKLQDTLMQRKQNA
ncbi:MAG: hypothetical protein ACAF41_25795 [Leptolyngbya sp. BL-A-14]